MNNSHQYAELVAKLMADQKQGPVRKKFLELGREFGTVNWPESAKLAKKYRARLNKCYDNCFKIALRDMRYRYAEGYALSVIPMEHAWLINEAGEVVDPTWSVAKCESSDYFGVQVPLDKLNFELFQPGWLKYVIGQTEAA